jgi:hypothetical protein
MIISEKYEKATYANHPLRTADVFDGAKLDDTLKRLYGLI